MITKNDVIALGQVLNRTPVSMAENLYFNDLLKRLDQVADMMSSVASVPTAGGVPSGEMEDATDEQA